MTRFQVGKFFIRKENIILNYLLIVVLLLFFVSAVLHNHFGESSCKSYSEIESIGFSDHSSGHHCSFCDLMLMGGFTAFLLTFSLFINKQNYSSLNAINFEIIPSCPYSGLGSRSPPYSSL
jgi:hypothetical protein